MNSHGVSRGRIVLRKSPMSRRSADSESPLAICRTTFLFCYLIHLMHVCKRLGRFLFYSSSQECTSSDLPQGSRLFSYTVHRKRNRAVTEMGIRHQQESGKNVNASWYEKLQEHVRESIEKRHLGTKAL